MNKDNDILLDSIDERIESFLRGTMSKEEETEFKQEIKDNPELRNRAMAMTSLIRGLQAKNKAIEESIIKENTTKSRKRSILWWACSIAAVLVIFFGINSLYMSAPPDKNENISLIASPKHQYALLNEIVSPYYIEYDLKNITRGDVDSTTIAYLYTLFSKIPKSRRMTDIIEELEPIYQSLDNDFTYHPWANDIAWNLALAYIKDDQIEKAIQILDKIKEDNPETPIYNKADELIKKLNDLKSEP